MKSEIKQIKCLLRLTQENLSKGNLKTHQIKLWTEFEDGYNGTLVIVRNNLDK